MMTEEGTVTRVMGEKAWVLAARSASCESCGHRKTCMPLGDDNKKIEVEAFNRVNARVGNLVNISLKSSSLMKVALLVYMVPIIMLFIGIFAGSKLAEYLNYTGEFFAIITGLIAFIATFFVIRLISKRVSQNKDFMPEITKIIS